MNESSQQTQERLPMLRYKSRNVYSIY